MNSFTLLCLVLSSQMAASQLYYYYPYYSYYTPLYYYYPVAAAPVSQDAVVPGQVGAAGQPYTQQTQYNPNMQQTGAQYQTQQYPQQNVQTQQYPQQNVQTQQYPQQQQPGASVMYNPSGQTSLQYNSGVPQQNTQYQQQQQQPTQGKK